MDRSRRAKKPSARALALQQLKQARDAGQTRTDQFEVPDEEDVYELMEETEYERLVHERRKKDDFVVDDDGLGYCDDGEEHLGVGEKSSAVENTSGNKAMKKARKFNELVRESQTNTMLKFVKTGQSIVPRQEHREVKALAQTLDLEKLLGDLDGSLQTAHPHTRKSHPNTHKPITSIQAHTSSNPTPLAKRSRLTNPDSISYTPLLETYAPVEDLYNQDENDNVDDNLYTHTQEQPFTPKAKYAAVNEEQEEEKENTPYIHTQAYNGMQTDARHGANAVNPPIQEHPEPTASQKSLKVLKASAPALAALQGARTVKVEQKEQSYEKPNLDGVVAQDLGDLITPSAPEIAVVSQDLSSFMEMDEEGPYLRMFWFDAIEISGTIYLFGKIQLPNKSSPSSHESGSRFVSCAVAVANVERNLLVLPRSKGEYMADGKAKRFSLGEVYNELKGPSCLGNLIPKAEGEGFKCKGVQRSYAFDNIYVPRESTEYLKVVYSARFPAPVAHVCSEGGVTFEKIFGAATTPLELFILKRKLMGPGWITIRDPQGPNKPFSWCKIEVMVVDPKKIQRMADPPAPPPLVSMSISMKTVVNPSTHTHECIVLSALTHIYTHLENVTDLSPQHMRQVAFVRPLGTSASPGYPAKLPHDIADHITACKRKIIVQPNERALLSAFFQMLQVQDPDIIISHNLYGFELDVILSRANALKLATWSKIGRLRRSTPLAKGHNIKDGVAVGRVLCDTYLAAKEFLRETSYSLTHIAMSQLQTERVQVDPIDVPRYFCNSSDVVRIVSHTALDAQLVMRLCAQLQVIPLTKQLTNLSGNLWRRTMQSKRAERIEFLLLHEFHRLKYILPERKNIDRGKKGKSDKAQADDENEDAGGKNKKSYVGGLVLEPKKGLYDKFILLLDFNSLYPSIIQEYNLCFTTVNWAPFAESKASSNSKVAVEPEIEGEEADVTVLEPDSDLPPLPEATEPGILPRVIKGLVERRRQVKQMLKREKDEVTYKQLDIRQKALKLTANSMYGCLGFAFSRFYAQPIAALITMKGREALMTCVHVATETLNLDVIYGDTDSIMINTNSEDLAHVKEIGNSVKREVNKLYKSLEIELDGIFKSMLLLKKKKYAALLLTESQGEISYQKEMKGLDLVRRDWCPLSKTAGRYVLDQILSGEARETVLNNIHTYVSELAINVRGGNVDLSEFVITKGLNKSPKDYPDVKGQPHLQVALAMLKADKPVNVGDHIPYVICKSEENLPPAMRAHHPDDVIRQAPALEIDYEWYLAQQILPPLSRLCEPIEGTSPAILAAHLQIHTHTNTSSRSCDDLFNEDDWGFTPRSLMKDSERFKNVTPLMCVCAECNSAYELRGLCHRLQAQQTQSPLACGVCGSAWGGFKTSMESFAYVSNRLTLYVRALVKRYYEGWVECDDHSCGRKSQQVHIRGYGAACPDCHGTLRTIFTEADVHTHIQYLEVLFDAHRGTDTPTSASALSKDELNILKMLHVQAKKVSSCNAYNWVRPSLWSTVFTSSNKL